MQCLNDYIGLLGCDNSVAPGSGIYINSLPGINLKSLQAIANHEQKTYLAAWNDIQIRAYRRFELDITSELNKKTRLISLQRSIDLGTDTTVVSELASAQYKGIPIDIRPTGAQSDWKSSALANIYVQQFPVYSTAAAATTIKVFDVEKQTQLYTKAVTLAVGWNTIEINTQFDSEYIFIAYDATLIPSFSKIIPTNTNYGYGIQSYVRGGYSDIPFTTASFTTGNDTYGSSVIYSVRCSFQNLVCRNKNLFTTAFWYLLGAETMITRLTSDEINSFTTIGLKRAEELHALYEERYTGALSLAVSGINLDQNDACIECNGQVTIKESGYY